MADEIRITELPVLLPEAVVIGDPITIVDISDITDAPTGTTKRLDLLSFVNTISAPLNHTHVENDITNLDKYSQAQIDSMMLSKADISHTHFEAAIVDLDKYTLAEVNALLGDKAPTVHTHTLSQITDAGTMAGINDAPSDGLEYVRKDGTWETVSGTGNVLSVFGRAGAVVAQSTDYAAYYAAINHNHDTDYAPLNHNHSELDISDLDKYSTSEIDALLAGKSDIDHTHTNYDAHLTNQNNPHNVDISDVGGIGEAPQDGNEYARKDAAWTVVTGGGGGVTLNYVTPEDYSAVGDGVTDDTTAMEAFFAAVQSTNVDGHMTAGKTYLVTDEINIILTGNMRLHGHGASIVRDYDELEIAGSTDVLEFRQLAAYTKDLDVTAQRGESKLTLSDTTNLYPGLGISMGNGYWTTVNADVDKTMLSTIVAVDDGNIITISDPLPATFYQYYVPDYNGTSTTSRAIPQTHPSAIGFTTQAGLGYVATDLIRCYYNGDNFFDGTVTSYSGTALVVSSTSHVGTGQYNDWKLGLLSQTTVSFVEPKDILLNDFGVGVIGNPEGSQTSTTSTAIPTSHPTPVSMTIGTGLPYAVDNVLKITSITTGDWFTGTITAYDSGTGAVTVDSIENSGTGTYTSWGVSKRPFAYHLMRLTTLFNPVVTNCFSHDGGRAALTLVNCYRPKIETFNNTDAKYTVYGLFLSAVSYGVFRDSDFKAQTPAVTMQASSAIGNIFDNVNATSYESYSFDTHGVLGGTIVNSRIRSIGLSCGDWIIANSIIEGANTDTYPIVWGAGGAGNDDIRLNVVVDNCDIHKGQSTTLWSTTPTQGTSESLNSWIFRNNRFRDENIWKTQSVDCHVKYVGNTLSLPGHAPVNLPDSSITPLAANLKDVYTANSSGVSTSYDIGDLAAFSAITRFSLSDPGSDENIITSSNALYLFLRVQSNGKLRFSWYNGVGGIAVFFDTDFVYPLDTDWRTIGFTIENTYWDGGTDWRGVCKLYIDGMLVHVEENIEFRYFYGVLPNTLRLWSTGSDGHADGYIAFETALSESEMAYYSENLNRAAEESSNSTMALLGNKTETVWYDDSTVGTHPGDVSGVTLLGLKPFKEYKMVILDQTSWTVAADEDIISVNKSVDSLVTITLPTSIMLPGKSVTVKDAAGNAATNNITVATGGSETIDGGSTSIINTNYKSTRYYSDGSNWFIY